MRGPACTFAVLLALAVAGCGDGDEEAEPPAGETPTFDAERAFADLKAQVRIGPRASGTRGAQRTAEFIADRLADAGATGIVIQEPYANVVGALAGSEPGTVIVGAHYDTKDEIPGFVGANDNASGVAVMLEVARSLPRSLPGPSIQFVGFDAEEARGDRDFINDGARGSEQFVEYAQAGGEQGAPPLEDIRAMVLFDLVGDCDLTVPRETSSDEELYGAFADAARELTGGPAPFEGTFGGVLDDHTAFVSAGVPSVVLIDFQYGPGPPPGAWWHTTEDSLDKVCPESLNAVGEAALRAIPRIR